MSREILLRRRGVIGAGRENLLYAAVMADGPVIFYPFETMTSTAVDHSGNGHNGTQTGVGAVGPGGFLSTAVEANDNTDGIFSPVSTNYTDFSVMAVVRFDGHIAGQDQYTIANKSSYYAIGTAEFPWFLYVTTGGVLAANFSTGGDFATDLTITGSNVNDGNWHVVHLTYDRDGNSTIYLDGVADASAASVSISNSTRGWSWMRATSDSGGGAGKNYFNGPLCYCVLYSHALSSSRVAAQYSAYLASI